MRETPALPLIVGVEPIGLGAAVFLAGESEFAAALSQGRLTRSQDLHGENTPP